jgi:uncharacterized protein YciI
LPQVSCLSHLQQYQAEGGSLLSCGTSDDEDDEENDDEEEDEDEDEEENDEEDEELAAAAKVGAWPAQMR